MNRVPNCYYKTFFIFTGINDQGLFRVVGVSSKVQKLLCLMIGKFSLIWLLCKCSSFLGDLLWSPIIVSRAGVLLSLIGIQTFILSDVCLYVPLSCPLGDTWLHYCRQAIRFPVSLSLSLSPLSLSLSSHSHSHSHSHFSLILFRLSQKPNTHWSPSHALLLSCPILSFFSFFLSRFRLLSCSRSMSWYLSALNAKRCVESAGCLSPCCYMNSATLESNSH